MFSSGWSWYESSKCQVCFPNLMQMNIHGVWQASEWACSGRRDLLCFLVGLKSWSVANSQPSLLLIRLVLAWKTTQVSFFEIHICNFCRKGLLFIILSWISNNMTKYRWFGLIPKFNLQKQVTSPWSVNWSGAMWNYCWSSPVDPESIILLACTSFICSYFSSSKWLTMSVSVLNDNWGFDLLLCPKIHLKETSNLQGNFTFQNNCTFRVQLLSVYAMVHLDGNTSSFYSRVPGLPRAKDVLLQNRSE